MYISKNIMEKVEEKEEYNKNLRRCLDTSTCPQCGANLKRRDVGGENLTEARYTCNDNNCHFTHKRTEG